MLRSFLVLISYTSIFSFGQVIIPAGSCSDHSADFSGPALLYIGDGTLRLINGQDHCQGRVEVYYQGNWGTVCDDDWDFNNAQVVCQQIGCGNAVFAHTNSYFGYGTGLVLLDNINCHGTEQELSKCKSLGWGKHNCGHHEDAGVTCTGMLLSVMGYSYKKLDSEMKVRFFHNLIYKVKLSYIL
uniref:SRCR domain-containing protein n=1 Tax=Mola mola TaxID=94237 RepID=A0A3Q3W6I4_MOLML